MPHGETDENNEKVFKRHGLWNEKFSHQQSWNYKVSGRVEEFNGWELSKTYKDNDLRSICTIKIICHRV